MNNEELFKVLSDKIDVNHENTLRLLNNIEEQTRKTNGTVRDHEKRLQEIALSDSRHVINCPQIPEIKKLGDNIESLRSENELWRIAVKYPKLALAILAVSVLVVFATVGYTVLEMHTMVANIKKEAPK